MRKALDANCPQLSVTNSSGEPHRAKLFFSFPNFFFACDRLQICGLSEIKEVITNNYKCFAALRDQFPHVFMISGVMQLTSMVHCAVLVGEFFKIFQNSQYLTQLSMTLVTSGHHTLNLARSRHLSTMNGFNYF